MWKVFKFLSLIILVVEIAWLAYFHILKPRVNVLGEAIENTPSPTLIPSQTPTLVPTPTESPTPSPTKEPTPTPLPTPSPIPPSEINALIDRFAGQYAVDPNVLRHIAICESGFKPSAANGPYIGLFQFAKTTWKNLRREFGENIDDGLRFSAEESVQTAAYALSKGKKGLWPNCAP